MVELSPSLLAADFCCLEKQLDILVEENIKYLHLDVMDGNFVPNISFGMPIIKSLREKYNFIFDVHLMIEQPERYIDDFSACGADIITFHPEATKHVHRTIQQIRMNGKKAGIVLNPHTPIDIFEYIIDDIDLILVMSVNPGFGGQQFIPAMLKKLEDVRYLIDSKKRDILLEVDGGVKVSNLETILQTGVDLVVSGSDIFKTDMRSQIQQYYKIFNKN